MTKSGMVVVLAALLMAAGPAGADARPRKAAASCRPSAESNRRVVLAFYTDDVIFHSPLVARLSHDPSGTVQGKAALRAYVKKGFEVFDHIKFTVLDVLRGVDSIAIHYMGITGTHVVEVLFFDKNGVVRESYVHYSSP